MDKNLDKLNKQNSKNNLSPEDLYFEKHKDILLSGRARKCIECNCSSWGRLPEVEILCCFCWLIKNNYIKSESA